MSKFKIGDWVRGTQTIPFLDKEVGIVRIINDNKFGVEFKNPHENLHTLGGRCKDGHGWWVEESDIELVESATPTLWEFVIPFTQIDKSADIARAVVDKISTMGCRTFTVDKKALENIKNKENETMRNTFTFTKGERTAIVVDTIEHKDSKNKTILEKKTREVKIPTITTTAKTINGKGSTTCDEEDFNERTGCLVASANMIASKSEEANLMYQIAIKSWGESICTTILETLANRAVGGDFNTTYKKWKKAVADYDKEQRTCKVCHKVYGTVNEARECEQAHRQRKVDKLNKYLERKHAMRMAKERLEKERKEQLVKDAMDKLTSEDKDNK